MAKGTHIISTYRPRSHPIQIIQNIMRKEIKMKQKGYYNEPITFLEFIREERGDEQPAAGAVVWGRTPQL